jgi:uncharacterized protein (TIGR03067 family)
MLRLVTLASTLLGALLCGAIVLVIAARHEVSSAPPPPAKAPVDRIADLIQQLGHKEFAKREAAGKELEAIGEPALDGLRKAAAANVDAEIRQRAEKIILSIRAAVAKKELAKLQGTWYTVSTNFRGTVTGENKTDTITYEGTDYVQRRNGQVWAAGTIAIVDATTNPKQIDYFGTEGEGKGAHVRAIYTLDGEDHQMCSGVDSRPKEFSGNAGFLRVTKRDKNGPPEIQFDSDILPTDLQLAESKEAVRRVILKVRPADGGTGTLALDSNAPKLDEFGEAIGGGKPSPVVKLDFTLKLDKKEKDRRLYEIRGPKIESRLSLMIYSNIMPWGDGRLLVHGKDGEVRYAINLRLPHQQQPPPPPPCHPGCFPAGTMVRIPDGTKAIERIRAGDLVTTIDAAGKASSVKVTDVFVTRNRVLEVRVDGAKLVTTETQPLALEGGGFRPAAELKPGDRIFRWVKGERRAAAVLKVSTADREAEVFNLILGDTKAFIAGDFLVRSKPPPLP